MQEYLALRESLSEIMRKGFMNLASARYAMGAERVSAAQRPAAMTATVRVKGE